jgi:hypothetical protein
MIPHLAQEEEEEEKEEDSPVTKTKKKPAPVSLNSQPRRQIKTKEQIIVVCKADERTPS